MWTMVYFRTLPVPINDLTDDFMDFFFKFANTYTEESILHGYVKAQADKESKMTAEQMRELGYTEEDILKAGLE